MKRLNIPLILGLILIIFIALMYIAPEKFTLKDPSDTTQFRTYKVFENGKEESKVEMSPIAPNEDNIFGTSKAGHDIYTRLIYGTKNTIKAVFTTVIMRFIFAIVFGVAAGMGMKSAGAIIKVFNTVFTAIPALIFSYLILSIKYLNGLQIEESIVIYAIVLTFVGWGKLANQIQDNTRVIMDEDFIEGEVSIGKSKIKIMLQNIMPHLMPNLAVLFFLEVGMVLFLMAQLAVLSVFLGPQVTIRKIDGSIAYIAPSQPAWNNELFYGLQDMKAIQKYYYWVLLYPGLAIFTGILAFNLTGEGLRIEFEKRTSRVISLTRKSILCISPRLYIQQIKRFKEYYKPVLIKTLCIGILLTTAFTPAYKSIYEFNTDKSLEHIAELTKNEYEGRMTGYEGGYKAGEYIIETLKDYGIEPYDGTNYTQEFDVVGKERPFLHDKTLGNALIKEAKILLKNEDGDIEEYELGKDFTFAAIKEKYVFDDFKDKSIEIKGKTVKKEKLEDIKHNNDKEFILVDKVNDIEQLIERVNVPYINNYSFLKNDISFLILNKTDVNPNSINCAFSKYSTHIVPIGKLKENILNGGYEVTINIKKPDSPKYPTRNIFGILPGKDWDSKSNDTNNKKIIVIGAKYDSLNNGINNKGSAIDASGAAVNLEIARTLSKLKGELDETIVFAFWDGNYTDNTGNRCYNTHRLFNPNHYDSIYFEINDIADEEIEKFEVKLYKYHFSNIANGNDILNNVKNNLKTRKIKHIILPREDFNIAGIGNTPFSELVDSFDIRVSLSAKRNEYLFTEKDKIENIDKEKIKTIGQYIIDMITVEKL